MCTLGYDIKGSTRHRMHGQQCNVKACLAKTLHPVASGQPHDKPKRRIKLMVPGFAQNLLARPAHTVKLFAHEPVAKGNELVTYGDVGRCSVISGTIGPST